MSKEDKSPKKQNKEKEQTSKKGTGKEDIKKKSGGDGGVNLKYNKLKKKHRYLRDEYSKVLESWEMATKQLKILLEERKFYKKKLESFFKSQNFIDEQIFKQNDNKVVEVGKTPAAPPKNTTSGSQQPGQVNQIKPMSGGVTVIPSTPSNNASNLNAIKKPITPQTNGITSTYTGSMPQQRPPPSSGSTYTGGPGGSSLYGNTNSLYANNTYRPPGSVPGSYSGLSSNGIGTSYGQNYLQPSSANGGVGGAYHHSGY